MGIDSSPMPELPPFIAGLELAGGFYRDAVRPILEREFADLVHSAALVGQGSEVLGFDDARSRDHDWGPRCQLFLAEADCERWADAVRAALRAQIGDARLRELNSLQGAVDQVVDSSSLVGSPIITGRMRAIYGD